jgi:hypothetical protein
VIGPRFHGSRRAGHGLLLGREGRRGSIVHGGISLRTIAPPFQRADNGAVPQQLRARLRVGQKHAPGGNRP